MKYGRGTHLILSFNNILYLICFWISIKSPYINYLRAGADDKPLRMVKTVLHELVKLRGTAIKGHLSMVPIDMQPQPIILAYIDLNLQVWMVHTWLCNVYKWLFDDSLRSSSIQNWTDLGSSQNVDAIWCCWANSLEWLNSQQPGTSSALCRCSIEGIVGSIVSLSILFLF